MYATIKTVHKSDINYERRAFYQGLYGKFEKAGREHKPEYTSGWFEMQTGHRVYFQFVRVVWD